MIAGGAQGCADRAEETIPREHGEPTSPPSTGGDFEPIGAIVGRITVSMARDAAFEEWASFESDLSKIPAPSVFAECRSLGATDELLARIIRLIAWAGQLRTYGGDSRRFVEFVGQIVAKGAA